MRLAFCQQFVGQAGVAVLLLNQGWHAHTLSSAQQRAACVAAHAHHGVRLELADDAAALEKAHKQFRQKHQVFADGATLQAGNGQAHNLESGSRNLFHFHTVVRAHKQNLCRRVAPLDGSRYRDGREDVSARSATANYVAFLFHIIGFQLCLYRFSDYQQLRAPLQGRRRQCGGSRSESPRWQCL